MSESTEKKDVSVHTTTQAIRPRASISPWDEMDKLFDTFLSNRWLAPTLWNRPERMKFPTLTSQIPSVDVIERDNEVVVRAELAGVDKKNLDISVTENTLTIEGSSRSEKKEEKGEYWCQEIRQGSFSRTIGLPSQCESAKAKASFENGILEVTIPKTTKSTRFNVEVK